MDEPTIEVCTVPAGAIFNIQYDVQAPPLKLDIGAGKTTHEGYTRCDLYPHPTVDYVFDCQGKWPFDDESAGIIYASHVIEHLENLEGFFNEAHRVLHPRGVLAIRVPITGHDYAWGSLSHKRSFSLMSFYGLQGNSTTGLDDAVGKTWKVRKFYRFVHPDAMWVYRWPWRYFLGFTTKHLYGVVCELAFLATKT